MSREAKPEIALDYYLSGQKKRAYRMMKAFKIGLSERDRERLSLAYAFYIRPGFYKR